MRLWKKLLVGTVALLVVGLGVLAIAISHNADCPPVVAAGPADGVQAVQQRCYGDAEQLTVETIARPTMADDEVLVRVHVASINPLDKHFMHGTPYVVRLFAGFGAPNDPAVGVDFAGVVEAVGGNVSRFAIGDRVFGAGNGSLGELIVVGEDGAVVKIPANVDFDQVAGLPVAAITALQALRDKAELRPGQHVLINGASGGVGTAAVQIAKAMGATVTGVCSGRNVALVKSLGADHVIDYTQEDFTQGADRFDAVIDMVSNHGMGDLLSVIEDDGVLVTVGDADIGAWIGPFVGMIGSSWHSLFTDQRIERILARTNAEDMQILADYAASGQLTTQVDQRYPLVETVTAMRYFEKGRTRGKVLIDITP